MQLAYNPASAFLGTNLRGMKCYGPKKYINMHNTFVHNSPTLGTIQMTFNWWMAKQIVMQQNYVYLTLPSNK